jgi:hypothetical protein
MTNGTLKFFAASVFLFLISFHYASIAFAESPEPTTSPITIESIGQGLSSAEARKDAIVNALNKVVGEYIESETIVENNKIVKDTILAFSNAENIKSEVISKRFVDGDIIEVTCKITINPGKVVGKVRAATASAVYINGEALSVEIEVMHDNIVKQREALLKHLEGLPTKLLRARLVDQSGNEIADGRIPREDIMMEGNTVVLALNIEVSYDLKAFYEKVYPQLTKLFKAMALEHHPSEVHCEKNNERDYGTICFTQLPYAAKTWTTNSNALKMKKADGTEYSHPSYEGTARRFTVLLSQSLYQQGMSESYNAYVFPKELFETLTHFEYYTYGKTNNTFPKLQVLLETKSGSRIASKHLYLVDFCRIAPRGQRKSSNAGHKERIPLDTEFGRSGEYVYARTFIFPGQWHIGEITKEHVFLNGNENHPIIFSPRFSTYNGSTTCFTNTIMLREYIELSKADFEKLSEIKFKFLNPKR